MPRRKFYSFYVCAAIDHDTIEWTMKLPRSKPCTCLLLYLSLAGFVCGFSLLYPLAAYAGEDEGNYAFGNSGHHKGFSGQCLRMQKEVKLKEIL